LLTLGSRKPTDERNASPEIARRDGTQTNTELPTLEKIEREHILRILEGTKWRIEGPKGAAMILGLHPSTLRSRMRKYGIQ
jgi:transcriptional regulator with GAF, ATPase, and Fis domain